MKDVEIETLNRELALWEDYRDHGQHEHSKTVRLLEQEMADMENSFTEISGISFTSSSNNLPSKLFRPLLLAFFLVQYQIAKKQRKRPLVARLIQTLKVYICLGHSSLALYIRW
jgi:hypothetical protein